MSGDPREIAERYRRFAEVECKGYSEAYYRLALAVAEDAEVLSFLGLLPVWQPNLFFAAVQFLMTEAPESAQLVVFHSAVLAYVAPERRRAFADVLAAASAGRDLVWISNEGPGIAPDLPDLAASRGGMRFVLGRTRFTRGERIDHVALALAHPHGANLQWLASA